MTDHTNTQWEQPFAQAPLTNLKIFVLPYTLDIRYSCWHQRPRNGEENKPDMISGWSPGSNPSSALSESKDMGRSFCFLPCKVEDIWRLPRGFSCCLCNSYLSLSISHMWKVTVERNLRSQDSNISILHMETQNRALTGTQNFKAKCGVLGTKQWLRSSLLGLGGQRGMIWNKDLHVASLLSISSGIKLDKKKSWILQEA